MHRVYVVQHIHELEEGEETLKIVGVYSSEPNAREAIRRLSVQPGFKDTPQGFSVEPYDLDVDEWVEGYITVRSGRIVNPPGGTF